MKFAEVGDVSVVFFPRPWLSIKYLSERRSAQYESSNSFTQKNHTSFSEFFLASHIHYGVFWGGYHLLYSELHKSLAPPLRAVWPNPAESDH